MAQYTLLELTTQMPERACIKIDGITYELRSKDDLGLREDAEFRGLHEDFKKAEESKDWRAMATLLDGMVRGAVIGIPDEVLGKLNDQKKLQIVQAFTKEVAASRAAASAMVSGQ